MYGYIYKTTNIQNGLIYVGQHKWHENYIDENYIGSGSRLIKAINEYGRENFLCEIIEYGNSQEDLDKKERYWIKELNSTDVSIGYNVHPGGHASGDFISVGVKHYWDSLSEEQRLEKSLLVSGERNGMYGHRHSETTKQLWKSRHRGEYKHSEDTKRKRSQSLLGRQFSEKTRILMSQNHADVSGENNPMYGKHLIFCNNGVCEKRVATINDIPEGFVLGRKPNISINRKWFTNGTINKFVYECPEGFYPGRIINKKDKIIKNEENIL